MIEHTADWIVDMGPEGGVGGGRVVAEGPPEHVATVAESHTGRFLADIVKPREAVPAKRTRKGKPKAKAG